MKGPLYLFLILTFLFCLDQQAHAQITPNIRLGSQEQSQVDKIKRIKKATKNRKKKSRKERKSEADSLANQKAEQEGERLKGMAEQAAKDTLGNQIDKQFSELEEYSEELDAAERAGLKIKEVRDDSLTMRDVADTVANEALKYGEKQLEKEVSEAIAAQGEAPDLDLKKGLPGDVPEGMPGDVPDPSQLAGGAMSKEELEKLKALMDLRQAARKAAKSKELMEVLPAIASSVTSALPSVDKVKQKYFKYGKIKGHPEKNIFKQQPLHKRFVWGGNLDVVLGLKNSLDFGPFLGYKINKVWEVYIGGKYRTEFNFQKKWYFKRGDDEMLGYQLFTHYTLYKSIFAYGGYENNLAIPKAIPNSPGDKDPAKVWVPSAMVGVGRKFQIRSNIGAHCLVLYDLLYDQETALYPRPWQVRMGFYKK